MIQRNTYDLVDEPAGEALRELLTWTLSAATQLGLVVNSHNVRLSSRAVAFLEDASPHLVAINEVSEWPGTQIIGQRRAILRIYRYNLECMELFAATAERLYMWVNPGLPEDPHLLREDGSVVLGTVAQEDDGWMQLNTAEYDSLIRSVPWMAGALRQQG
jgi:hypothetical protein